ncbi:MAG TPA: NAD(P)H-binding protein [Polyangia bacterium]|jgi:uncharacterized protein YbjT (DUF2867 family)
MYVIAGVTGHVGSHAARALLAQGKQVKVIVRSAAKGAEWAQRGAAVAVGSLEDAAFLTDALKGATGFFTLLPGNFAAPDFYADQRRTADSIAAAVKASRVPHVVMLSSIGADLEAGTGPIRGLHYLENALRATGTKLTALRPGYFQENLAQSLGAARAAGIYPNFGAPVDLPMPMIATRDIGAQVVSSLLEPPAKGEIVDIVGPGYSVQQLADKLGAALGKKLQITTIPPEGWVPAMMQAGMPQHIAEVFAEMYAGFGTGKIRPVGDRMVPGHTTIDEVIRDLVK